MRSSFSFLWLSALALATVHCGPPVATQPAPTPVYAEALTVPPAEILQESLDDSEVTKGKSARDSKAEPTDEPRLQEAPVEPTPDPAQPETDAKEPSGSDSDGPASAP